jgi:NADH-quinone oxidoreductase subunit L
LPALIATWIGFLVLVYSLGYMKGEENLARYYALVLLFIGGMVGMALADNFLALFFFWEVMGVCSYQLIAFFYKDPKAAAAGAKAFLTTKIGDIGLLAAIIILAVNTGSFSFSVVFGGAAGMALPVLGLVAFGFILGAVGKSAQFPLHVWLPDAMEAPTTISALIHAATMVNAGVYLLARVSPLLALVPWSLTLVQWIGAITALLGALLAAFNNDLKRILAYSTVSQLGYMVLAVGVGAAFASQFHLFSHAIFKGLLFLCAGAVIHAIGTRDIRQMGGLYKHMPAVAITFLIGAMALLGLPFLNGFFSSSSKRSSSVEPGGRWPWR